MALIIVLVFIGGICGCCFYMKRQRDIEAAKAQEDEYYYEEELVEEGHVEEVMVDPGQQIVTTNVVETH